MFGSIDADDCAAFARDGFVFKRGFVQAHEMAIVDDTLAGDPAIRANVLSVADSSGASTELALWNHPADDIFGAIARSRRIAGGAARLLGGEVYHYHTKLTMKRPRLGGAWDWHQDYGYWYGNGCLFPDMLSVAVAVDPATRENGCLQLLRGSHRLGRVDHGRIGGQTGADPDRVEAVMRVCPLEHAEMAPGDALFFHCNVLHSSAQNRSDKPRTLMLSAFNRASNDPVREHHHPRYTPLDILDDAAVATFRGAGARDYLAAADDATAELRATA